MHVCVCVYVCVFVCLCVCVSVCVFVKISLSSSTELGKYKRYEIVMTAYNVIGESPPSSPVEVFVGEAGRNFLFNFTAIKQLKTHLVRTVWPR